MLGLRVILGTFEAGLFPGAVYLLSLCYTRCTLISKLLYFFAAILMYTVLARRQMADPQPNSRLQLPPNNPRPMSTRIGSFTGVQYFSVFLIAAGCNASPGRAFLAGKQHPRPVETSLLQC